MKTYILTLLFLSATFILDAQQFEWAKSFGGTGYDIAYSITTDALGNVYTAGYFEGTVDFDPGVGIVNLTSNGIGAGFVQKMDSLGNFLWAKSMGGTGNDFAISISITTDASGNVYTAGRFQGTVDFDPGVGIVNLTSNGIGDGFVQKMDSLGNFLWAKSMGGTGNDNAYSITTDALGNVYTAGNFVGTVDFDPGVGIVNLTSNGNYDGFVQKMDSLGNFLWAKSMGGTGNDYAYSITTDASGNVYTAGYFVATVDFDPGVGIVNLTSNGNYDGFVQKMDSLGNFLWAKSFGATGYDNAYSITTDALGNVYTAGYFEGTVDFDPGVGIVNLTSNGIGAGFVQKMDSLGNFLWAKSFGGTGYDNALAYSITTDALGNVYTAGYFQATVDFDPGVGIVNLTWNGGYDCFVQKMDSLGNFLWAKSMGGTGNDFAYSITTDALGNVYTAGYFEGTVDFDPGVGIVNLTSNGNYDGFVQKWSQCNTTFQTDIQTACISYTWINGVTYTSSNNSATQTLTNSAGCDSVVTLNLTINNSNTGTDVQTACNSYTWIDGNTYTASNNTATDILTNSVGCDSVVTLNLTINNSNTGTDVQTACISYTWINGITYYSSNNIATQTLTNAAGCDSVVTLNLTINNSNTGIDVQTACNSYTWIDGVTYTSSNNTATDTLTNSAGCDSVVTLNLTITNSSSATDVVSSCNSYTWINGITYTSSNNTATQTLTNAAGCDSIVTLNLTITNSPLISQPINQTVNIGNNAQFQFLTSGTSLNYQWQMDVGTGYVNLSNAGQFSGADTNLLMVSNVNMANNNTNFRCIITESSTCKDTTNSVKLFVSSGTSIIEQTTSLVNLYPNPTSYFVTINLANKSKGQVIVLDLLGKVVLNKEFNSNQIQLSLKSIESKGTYLVKIIDSNGNVIANKKLIYQ